MTIAEIESVLRELRSRHKNLNEEMLTTLLMAGGWEDKVIKDTLVIFRSSQPKATVPSVAVLAKTNIAENVQKKVVSREVVSPDTSIKSSVISQEKLVLPKIQEPVVAVPVIQEVKPVVLPTVPVPLSLQKESAPVSVTTSNPQGTEKSVNVQILKSAVPSTKEIPPPVKENKIPITSANTSGSNFDFVYYDGTGAEEPALKNIPTAPGSVRVVEEKHIPKIEKKVEQEVKKEPIQNPVVPVVAERKVEQKVVTKVPPKVESKEVPKIKESNVSIEIHQPIPPPPQYIVQKQQEPQSLIEHVVEVKTKAPLPPPPENLPLKPFESTPHVWPFSKYKEVFHGEATTLLSNDERILVKEASNKEVVPEEKVIKKVIIKKSNLDAEDEGLIFLTGMSLLVILILLAYMYGNGRL